VTAEALTHSRETLAHFGATILFLILQNFGAASILR